MLSGKIEPLLNGFLNFYRQFFDVLDCVQVRLVLQKVFGETVGFGIVGFFSFDVHARFPFFAFDMESATLRAASRALVKA
jgi:hypothetical protein